MPLVFDTPPAAGALRQGELLAKVWIHRPLVPAGALRTSAINVANVEHGLVVVMTSDCDLLQDFNARSNVDSGGVALSEGDRRLVPQVLICDVFECDEIRPQFDRDLWRRIKQNQDERYHRFASAPIGGHSLEMPELYIDFKRVFGVFTAELYDGITNGGVIRKAVVPSIYLHDLMHRFFGFLSRVGVPD